MLTLTTEPAPFTAKVATGSLQVVPLIVQPGAENVMPPLPVVLIG